VHDNVSAEEKAKRMKTSQRLLFPGMKTSISERDEKKGSMIKKGEGEGVDWA